MNTILEENKIETKEKSKRANNFDYKKIYDDEFYDCYVNNFEKNTHKRCFYKFVKRCFDFFTSLIALIILIPLF